MFQMNNSFKLVDYDSWYQMCWANGLIREIQKEYGVTPIRILRNDDDPNHAIVILEAASLNAFEKSRSDERIQKIITDKSIVTERQSNTYTVTEIGSARDGGHGFHVGHKLVDYDKWFEMFSTGSARKEIEANNGIKCIRVLRDVNNPNEAVVIFTAPSQEAMDKLHNDPRTQEIFSDRSIFIEPPQVLGRFTPIAL